MHSRLIYHKFWYFTPQKSIVKRVLSAYRCVKNLIAVQSLCFDSSFRGGQAKAKQIEFYQLHFQQEIISFYFFLIVRAFLIFFFIYLFVN